MLAAAPVQHRTRPRRDAAPERAVPPAGVLPRGASNALLARWALQQRGPCAVQRTEPKFGFPEKGGMPEQDREAFREAWELLKEIEQRRLSTRDIERIARLTGEGPDPTPLLQRFNASNVGLSVSGVVGKPGDAGVTYLHAAYGEGEQEVLGTDRGTISFVDMMAAFDPLDAEQRRLVKFTVVVKISTPKPAAYGRSPEGYDVGFFLEALIHELAVHAEKYLPQLEAYAAGKANLAAPVPVTEHRELLFAPNARTMQYLKQIEAAAAKGENIGGWPAKTLLAKVTHELGKEPASMNSNERQPLKEEQTVLGWVDELLGAEPRNDELPALQPVAAAPRGSKCDCCVLV